MLFRALLTACAMAASIAAQDVKGTPHVLVYTATRGYRHDSIPTAIEVLGQNAADHGVSFVFTEDPGMFTDDTLKTFDGVMFVSNSEEVLDLDGQAALRRFFQSGGVYTGVHAASACLFNDTTYLQAVGAYFDYHPDLQPATFIRLNTTHPATAPVPDRWSFTEEVYYFRSDPRTLGAEVVMTVDEASYNSASFTRRQDNGTSTGTYPPMGDPHPIAWYIESPESAQPLADGATKAGRSFYTSLGHLNETWQNATFIAHVFGGLTWALDGASTRAYGVGLVGNATGDATGGNVTAGGGGAASGSGSGTGTVSSSVSASSAPSASGGAGTSGAGRVGVAGAAVLGAAGAVAVLL